MEKLAQTDYPVIELLRRRWSPRAFADQMIEPEKLQSLFEAARWSPSSLNEQPWSFVMATKQKPEEHARLLSCLVEKNQEWARQAPVLMVSVTRLNFEKTGKPNRHAFHDVGQAVANLAVEATAQGLSVHQMAGFSPEKVRELFAVPEGFEPVAAIALGYGVDTDDAPEAERSTRSRKPIKTFVFESQWGQPSPLIGS